MLSLKKEKYFYRKIKRRFPVCEMISMQRGMWFNIFQYKAIFSWFPRGFVSFAPKEQFPKSGMIEQTDRNTKILFYLILFREYLFKIIIIANVLERIIHSTTE